MNTINVDPAVAASKNIFHSVCVIISIAKIQVMTLKQYFVFGVWSLNFTWKPGILCW
jgi:hypothetical protein